MRLTQGTPGEAAFFPMVKRHDDGRGNQRAVYELIDKNLGDYGHEVEPIAEPHGLQAVKGIDLKAFIGPEQAVKNAMRERCDFACGLAQAQKQVRDYSPENRSREDAEGKAPPRFKRCKAIAKSLGRWPGVISNHQADREDL